MDKLKKDNEVAEKLKDLQHKRYWKCFWAFLIFLFIAGGIGWGLFNAINIATELWLKAILFLISHVIATSFVVFITKELPYSLEDTTLKKGVWWIERDIAQKLEILGYQRSIESFKNPLDNKR